MFMESITLNVKGQRIELSLAEAKELRDELTFTFGKATLDTEKVVGECRRVDGQKR